MYPIPAELFIVGDDAVAVQVVPFVDVVKPATWLDPAIKRVPSQPNADRR